MTQIFQDTSQNSLLSGILSKAKQHLIIDQLLKTHLEKGLQMHCQVAQLQGNTLIVHISSGLWLTRINCAIPQLMTHLKTYPFLANLEKIQCKVRPFDSTAKQF